ncbi:hypothetical protein FA95DRAFT_1599033, partial [Auriscalpium vulgare]
MVIAANATKRCRARDTFNKWTAHKTAGTFPQHLRSKPPHIQMSKGFAEKDTAATHRSGLDAAHAKYQLEALEASLRAKKDEVAFLDDALTPEKLYSELMPVVVEVGNRLCQTRKLPELVADDKGNLTATGWLSNEPVRAICQALQRDIVLYAYRIISIVEERDAAAKSKATRKAALDSDVDVTMADATGPSTKSIQAIVDKAVGRAIQKTGKKPASKKKLQPNAKASGSKGKDPRNYVPPPTHKRPRATGKSTIPAQKRVNAALRKEKAKAKGKGKST